MEEWEEEEDAEDGSLGKLRGRDLQNVGPSQVSAMFPRLRFPNTKYSTRMSQVFPYPESQQIVETP